MDLITEIRNFYLKIENGYVVGTLQYDPQIPGYQLFQALEMPEKIVTGCYQLIESELVWDEEKYKTLL